VGAIEPTLTAEVERRASRTLVVKLEAGGDAPLVDVARAVPSTRPVAQALNAAIDGFMRSSSRDPCVRLAGRFVASYDGTVRGLAPTLPHPVIAPAPATGCAAASPPPWLLIAVVAFVIRSRRG